MQSPLLSPSLVRNLLLLPQLSSNNRNRLDLLLPRFLLRTFRLDRQALLVYRLYLLPRDPPRHRAIAVRIVNRNKKRPLFVLHFPRTFLPQNLPTLVLLLRLHLLKDPLSPRLISLLHARRSLQLSNETVLQLKRNLLLPLLPAHRHLRSLRILLRRARHERDRQVLLRFELTNLSNQLLPRLRTLRTTSHLLLQLRLPAVPHRVNKSLYPSEEFFNLPLVAHLINEELRLSVRIRLTEHFPLVLSRVCTSRLDPELSKSRKRLKRKICPSKSKSKSKSKSRLRLILKNTSFLAGCKLLRMLLHRMILIVSNRNALRFRAVSPAHPCLFCFRSRSSRFIFRSTKSVNKCFASPNFSTASFETFSRETSR